MHAGERYQTLHDKLTECSQELELAKQSASQLSASFEDVKSSRQALFQECYRHVSEVS